MKKMFLLLLLFIYTPLVYAYENEYFKIDIPDNYKEIEVNKDTFKWENQNNNRESIIITLSDNKLKKYNIENYSSTDVNRFKTYLEEKFTNELKEYNIKVEIKNVKKEKINDLYTIKYDTIWPTKDSISYDIYQKGYSFTTKKYFYIITLSSDKETSNQENIINSFIPKDDAIKSTGIFNKEWKKVLFASIIIGIIGMIISMLKKRK